MCSDSRVCSDSRSEETGPGTLTGSVVDAKGSVLFGAKVTVDPGEATAVTNQDGQFALTAVAYGLNLNNEVFGFYNGSTIYPVQREFYRQTIGGGLRWSPKRERN